MNTISCHKCNKIFKYQSQLDRHLARITNCKIIIENNELKCKKCNIQLSNKYNLARHYKTCKTSTNVSNNPIEANAANINVNLEDILTLVKTNIEKNIKSYIENIKISLDNKPIQNIQNIIGNQQNIQTQIIMPVFINPHGFEDISHISDEDKLKILTANDGVILAIKSVYKHMNNRNFYRPNVNKPIINILDSDMSIQCSNKEQFDKNMFNKGIIFMNRLLYSCKDKLSFQDKYYISKNIERNKKYSEYKDCITNIINIIDTCAQDKISKNIFKRFVDKISLNEVFKQEMMQNIKDLILELERFYKDLNNVSITDEQLKQIWTKDTENNKDIDIDNIRNNLEIHYIKDTPRHLFMKERQEEEMQYFNEHGISLGNLSKYRMLLLERARDEIELLHDKYKNDALKEELSKILIDDTNEELQNKLNNIKLINPENLLDM